jgi:hypothetical protein
MNCWAHFFGAINEMRQSGKRRGHELPFFGGPESIFQPKGTSTLIIGVPELQTSTSFDSISLD